MTIVNVNKAVISNNSKINYSWVKQGASGEVQIKINKRIYFFEDSYSK